MTDIAAALEAQPKPRIHQLPWPRLNCLLAGLPGFSIEASMQGGIADGEVMALCSGPRGFRTTVAVFIAGHFIEKHEKKVAVFSWNEELVREGVAMARQGFSLSTKTRPEQMTYWGQNENELDVFSLSYHADLMPQLKQVDPATGAIIIDVDTTGPHQARDLALAAKHIAVEQNVPVFCSFQLGRRQARGADHVDRLPSDNVGSTVDHIIHLDHTETRQYLVMQMVQSRVGAVGVLLLDGFTFEEVL